MRQRTGVAGRIHAELHSVGLSLRRGELLTRAGRHWVHTGAWPFFGPEQQSLIETHEQLIDVLTELIKGLDRRIARIGREIPAVALLETIPGIGAYRALLIVSETDPISRFEHPKNLVSYAGLAPVSSRSGKSVRYGAIPASANRWLRNAFVQAALSHCRFAPDSPLARYYETQKERVGWRVARIATARKLARVVHAMLRTGEVWSAA